MLQDPKKRENLYYDNRWFYNHTYWLLPMILFPNIMRYNVREVYENIDHPFQAWLSKTSKDQIATLLGIRLMSMPKP